MPDIDLSALTFKAKQPLPTNAYIKRTLLRAPLVIGIFPEFKAAADKPYRGLASSSLNDEADQCRHPPEHDSYFAADDDPMWDLDIENLSGSPVPEVPAAFLSPRPETPKPHPSQSLLQNTPKLESLDLVVRQTSLVVEGVEHALPLAVSAAVQIAGGPTSEDSLLVTLASHFLLLIRFWNVPVDQHDVQLLPAGRGPQTPTKTTVWRPYIVQWWRLDDSGHPPTNRMGNALTTHPAGLAVACVAAENIVRVHMCQQTPQGLLLSPHTNIPINGTVLHSCFAHPNDTDNAATHATLMVLSLTQLGRLEISLYSWYATELIAANLLRSTLPLSHSFPMPVLVAPLALISSFLLVSPEEFVVVSMHNVWSADYAFSKYAYDGSFPTAISSCDSSTADYDELHLASDSGVIYSVVVTHNELAYHPLVRVPDSVSVFTLQLEDDMAHLYYASDTGGAKRLLLGTFSDAYLKTLPKSAKLPYSEGSLIHETGNWAPIVDVAIIKPPSHRRLATESAHELWSITGLGKRAKLTQLRRGLAVARETLVYEAYQRAESLHPFACKGRTFVVCSLPLESVLLEVSGSSLNEIDGLLIQNSPTICCAVWDGVAVQVTSTKIAATDLHSHRNVPVNDEILLAAIERDYIFVVTASQTLKVLKFTSELEVTTLASRPLTVQASVLTTTVLDDEIVVFLGSFEGQVNVLSFNNDFVEVASIDIKNSESVWVPHSVTASNALKKLFVGTKQGTLLVYDISSTPQLTSQFLLGSMPMALTYNDDRRMLFVCMQNVWALDFNGAVTPKRVMFNDKFDKSTSAMAALPNDSSHNLRFAFVRQDGLQVGSVFTHDTPVVRQLRIGEPAKKLYYLETHHLFVFLCKSKSVYTRLKFADRKMCKMMTTVECDAKTGGARPDPIFGKNEVPTCALIWNITRHDRVSKKLIVGTADGTRGSLKIIDVSKVILEGANTPMVKVVELISIGRDAPVMNIEQIGSTIFFTSGPHIYTTSYSLEQKKLRAVLNLVLLTSPIVSLKEGPDSTLLVVLATDSLIVFKYSDDSEFGELLEITFKDPATKSPVNSVSLDNKYYAGDKMNSLLVILQDTAATSLNFSMIPRVYTTNFTGPWSDSHHESLCLVGVNGEVIYLEPTNERSDELSELKNNLTTYGVSRADAINEVLERLERPFADKVTGKGFQQINRPFFALQDNQKLVIDYDLEHLVRLMPQNIIL